MTVTCLVDVEGGKDLAAIAIKDCDKLTLEEIASYTRERATKVRNKQDEEHKKRTSAFTYIPTSYKTLNFMFLILYRIIKVLFILLNFVANVLGIDVEAIQVKKFPFGAATVTSLGMLGVRDCWSPNNCIIIIFKILINIYYFF